MTNEAIPDVIREFVLDHIDSVELLEVLLLLRRHHGEAWTCQQISVELRTNPDSIANRIKALRSKGLLSLEGRSNNPSYKYEPSSKELAKLVDGLARYYAERRVSVIELIFSRPRQKIQTFAEAFRFRKD